MRARFIPLLGAAFCATLLADDFADRAKLIGTWESTDPALTLALEQNGDAIRITESHADQQPSKIECNVGGKECQVKDSGRSAKIMLWYNGAKLVEMETRGSEVVKRRFSASDDAMEIELIPIVPDGKPQVTKLKRAKVAAVHP